MAEMNETQKHEAKELEDGDIVKYVMSCRDEADSAKTERMAKNKDNFDMFHLKHDFSHKEPGQSMEVLSKQSMAVEQIKSFFQQALVDIGDWWSADAADPLASEQQMLIRPFEITKLTNYMLEKSMYFSHVGNSVQSALLGSLAISKAYGCLKPKPRFVVNEKGRGKKYRKWLEKIEDKTWEMKFEVVRAENFYPDPTGNNMYVIEDMWLDMHKVRAMSKGDDAIYDPKVVEQLKGSSAPDVEDSQGKARETGQTPETSGFRPKVKITEFWGDVIDDDGELCYENYVITIANDTHLLRCEPNPLWHQQNPYNYSPLMEVANSVWHKAPMDAPTNHNRALIEMYNLVVDAAMKQVHAVSQLRKDALDNPAQVQNGIKPGTTLMVNSSLPVGAKVLESVTTVQIPAEAFNVFNIMSQEFNASALTNDLRQGVMPFRAVKATEVVEASQTITSVFQGIAKNYEARQSVKELELAWKTTAQNWHLIGKEVFQSLFGEARGEEMSQMDPEDVFAATVGVVKFRVYGISLTLSKAQDFKKLTTLLQTIIGSPPLLEEYLKKYDLGKTLGEIMTSLNIDKYKLEIPKAVQATMQPQAEAPQAPQAPGPDMMSQVANPSAEMAAPNAPNIPQASFPGSPATGGM